MSRKEELKYLFLIIIVFIAACIETDIYLPAFPDMMAWFSVSEGAIQSLLTWNFVGICLSGPFYGPISDSFGRKKPLMLALGMFLIGSIIALFSQNMNQMLAGRILQGVGSGGCFTLGTAIIFDAFKKERAIAATNTLNMIVPLIMGCAPLAGGFLNQTFGFRSNFLAIVLTVLISFFVCQFFFKETLAEEKRAPLKMKKVLSDFKQAFTNVAFWQVTIMMSLLFSAYIAFLSGASVLFVVEFGMSEKVFPFVQGAILGGWVCGSLLLKRGIAKLTAPKVKKAGIILSIVGTALLGITTVLTPQNPYLLTIGMVLYAFGANWMIGLYFPEGMEILPDIKGVTASLMTSARLLIAALMLGISSALYNSTIYPLTAVVIGTLLIILPLLYFYDKRKEVARISVEN